MRARSSTCLKSSFQRAFDEGISALGRTLSLDAARTCAAAQRGTGGADLSKLHDLTAAAIVGEIPAAKAANEDWTPSEDVLVIVPHASFRAHGGGEKQQMWITSRSSAGRTTAGLDMPNESSMDPTGAGEAIQEMVERGLRIRKVGYDRKFARPLLHGDEKRRATVVDQPQSSISRKARASKYLSNKMKNRLPVLLRCEPFEYCVGNIRACEKVDDAVQYEDQRHLPHRRVRRGGVGTIRMLIDTKKRANASR